MFPTCNFFLEYDPRFSVAPFQLRPERTPKSVSQYTFTFLTNDLTLCSVSEQLVYECRWHEILPRSSIQRCVFMSTPLDLCYANQDLH